MIHSLPDQCPTCEGELDYWADTRPGGPDSVGWGCCYCDESGTTRLTTVLDQERYPTCPVCDSEPADVSWQTAGNQNVCPGDCPIVSWIASDEDQEARS